MYRFFVPFLIALVFAGVLFRARAQERALPRNFSNEWLQFSEVHTAAYCAPAWKRLVLSIRPWGEVGGSKARMRLDTTGANLSGAWLDNDRFSYSKMIPDSYGIGISGGIEW